MTGLLIAPPDLARFAIAYLILAVVPGYALATLLRPGTPRIERAALCVPCAYSLVAICGLATALLRLPFNVTSYAVLALPITIVGIHRAWRSRTEQPSAQAGWWWLVPVGVAVMQLGAIALVYARDAVPSGSDAVSHVIWAGMIARSHIFPIALMSTHIGDNDGGFYPPVFHAVTALALNVAPMPTYRAVFFSVVATIAFLPLALFSYVRSATGSARLGGLAALASLAFEPLPFFVLPQSLYTLTVALLFPPGLALVLRDGLGCGKRGSVVLAAMLGIGLFYTHHTELITAGLLTIAITPGLLHGTRAWRRACLYGVVIMAVWVMAALPAIRAARRTLINGALAEISATHDFAHSSQAHVGAALDAYLQWVYGHNLGYLLLGAVVVGCAWCVAKRRFLGLVVVQFILFALFIDANSYSLLRPFYVLAFPWALWERMAATHYWFALPLAAIGVDATARSAWRYLHATAPLFVAIAASPCVLLGLLLPLSVASERAAAYSNARKVVAAPDIGALSWLRRRAPAGSVIVNDADMGAVATFDAPIDAGLWLPPIAGMQPLFWRSGSGPGSMDARLYLLRHIAEPVLQPRAAHFIKLYHVRYVFYGAGVRPGAARHLRLASLLSDPQLHLAYASASACYHDAAPGSGACPANGSYVFAIDASDVAGGTRRHGLATVARPHTHASTRPVGTSFHANETRHAGQVKPRLMVASALTDGRRRA